MQQKARVQDADPCAVAPLMLAYRAFRFESERQNPLGAKMGNRRRTWYEPWYETISFKKLAKNADFVGSERGTRYQKPNFFNKDNETRRKTPSVSTVRDTTSLVQELASRCRMLDSNSNAEGRCRRPVNQLLSQINTIGRRAGWGGSVRSQNRRRQAIENIASIGATSAPCSRCVSHCKRPK
jgi:hypothetical protein